MGRFTSVKLPVYNGEIYGRDCKTVSLYQANPENVCIDN